MPYKNPEKQAEVKRTFQLKWLEHFRRLVHPYKNVPCADCNQRFPPVCMDFDHRIPSEKSFGLSVGAVPKSVKDELLLKEISKCDVVCANCHRLRTFARSSNGKKAVSEAG
jgi:hypothetical protein